MTLDSDFSIVNELVTIYELIIYRKKKKKKRVVFPNLT